MIPKHINEIVDRDGDAWVRTGNQWSFLDDDLHLDEEIVVGRYGPVKHAAIAIPITDEMAASVCAEADYLGFDLGEGNARTVARAVLEAAGFMVAGDAR